MHDSRFHSKCVQFGELLLSNRHHNIIAWQTESIIGTESIEEFVLWRERGYASRSLSIEIPMYWRDWAFYESSIVEPEYCRSQALSILSIDEPP